MPTKSQKRARTTFRNLDDAARGRHGSDGERRSTRRPRRRAARRARRRARARRTSPRTATAAGTRPPRACPGSSGRSRRCRRHGVGVRPNSGRRPEEQRQHRPDPVDDARTPVVAASASRSRSSARPPRRFEPLVGIRRRRSVRKRRQAGRDAERIPGQGTRLVDGSRRREHADIRSRRPPNAASGMPPPTILPEAGEVRA